LFIVDPIAVVSSSLLITRSETAAQRAATGWTRERVVLRIGERLVQRMGLTGIRVMTRILALLLARSRFSS
jgi:hypothetical protein